MHRLNRSVSRLLAATLLLPLGVLLLPASAACSGPDSATEARAALERRGFECTPGRYGLTCIGRIGGYRRDVALLVPAAYRVPQRAPLIVHLHGHNPSHRPLAGFVERFEYARMLAQTGRNAVLLAPWSDGSCEDFEAGFGEAARFEVFVEGAARTLAAAGLAREAKPGPVTLTGHSGAYRAISTIIDNQIGRQELVSEVVLLDATYGRARSFARFAAAPTHRFWSAYSPSDPDMGQVNAAMMRELEDGGVPFALTSDRMALSRHRVGFVVSRVGHDDAVGAYWPILLQPVNWPL